MVYKSDLTSQNFETMEEYFEHIVESEVSTHLEHIKAMSKDQRKDFIDWCEIWSDDSNIDDPYVIVKDIALSLI